MSRILNLRETGNRANPKNRRIFHHRYLELCRANNVKPQREVCGKRKETWRLDFYGEKLSVLDWLLIFEALNYDQALQSLSIRLRKQASNVLEHLDTEKKAQIFKQKPSIYTKFVFCGLVEAVAKCISSNINLFVLNLERLPLRGSFVESIAKALTMSKTIKEVSFDGSNVQDEGCEIICSAIKYMESVEKLNLSACQLTDEGARFVADMIKTQNINRYTEAWQRSLRYGNLDPDAIKGLRWIALARNRGIGDDSVLEITSVLKEDEWVKVIDMEDCDLTDRSANLILDCLQVNSTIHDFNVRNNSKINKFLQHSIRDQLSKSDDDQQSVGWRSQSTAVSAPKVSVPQMLERVKYIEQQLAFERLLRHKAELLSEKLNKQIIAYQSRLESRCRVPDGYVAVKTEYLRTIIRSRKVYQEEETDESHDGNPTAQRDQRDPLRAMSASELPTTSNAAPQTYEFVPPIARRRPMRVRQVRSEMKYVEPLPKYAQNRREPRSDHEYANRTVYNLPSVHLETNIGDVANVPLQIPGVSRPTTSYPMFRAAKTALHADFEGVALELNGQYSSTDVTSSDSDTLRQPFRNTLDNALDFMPKPFEPNDLPMCQLGQTLIQFDQKAEMPQFVQGAGQLDQTFTEDQGKIEFTQPFVPECGQGDNQCERPLSADRKIELPELIQDEREHGGDEVEQSMADEQKDEVTQLFRREFGQGEGDVQYWMSP